MIPQDKMDTLKGICDDAVKAVLPLIPVPFISPNMVKEVIWENRELIWIWLKRNQTKISQL